MCSSLNLLFLVYVILRGDGLLGKMIGTIYRVQVNLSGGLLMK